MPERDRTPPLQSGAMCTVAGYQCDRCGHRWRPRVFRLPQVCPKCKRRDWNGGPVSPKGRPLRTAPAVEEKPAPAPPPPPPARPGTAFALTSAELRAEREASERRQREADEALRRENEASVRRYSGEDAERVHYRMPYMPDGAAFSLERLTGGRSKRKKPKTTPQGSGE